MNEYMDEKAHNPWGDLCSCEERISSLGKEIMEMEKFISAVSGSAVDRADFVQSLGLDECKMELEQLKMQKESLAKIVDEFERKRLGEEIRRTPSGSLDIPWEDLYLAEVQSQINSVFGATE